MLRTLAIAIIVALGAGSASAEKPAPPKPTAPAAAAFPLPKDASAPTEAPGGGRAIQVYQVPRGRDAVIVEVRDLFKAGGWAITKDDPSPSGRAVRLEVTKDKKVYKVSFTGDASKTAMIVTLP